MFKLLTLALGIYFFYYQFTKRNNLSAGEEHPPLDHDDEYVDYEEVD